MTLFGKWRATGGAIALMLGLAAGALADGTNPGERVRPREWFSGGCTFSPLAHNLSCTTGVATNSQAAGYTLATSDSGKLVKFTGASNATWTVLAAATAGSTWWAYLQNAGTSPAHITLARSGADTIDGLTTYYMFPGEVRLITSDGVSAFNTIILQPFYLAYTATVSGEIVPPGYKTFVVEMWGGGASGASRTSSGSNQDASGGGGGGHMPSISVSSALLGSTWTATVGAQVAGVSGNTDGTNGNDSTFVSGSLTLTANHGVAGTNANGLSTGGTGGVGGVGAVYQATTLGAAAAAAGSSYDGGGSTPAASGNTGPGASGSSIFGAGGGATIAGTGTAGTAGTSTFGGAGGAGSNSGSATAGSAPGGGGGASLTGTSGAGARGEVRVRGLVQ